MYSPVTEGSRLSFVSMEGVGTDQQIARAAGRFAKKWLPVAKKSGQIAKNQIEKQWLPTAKQSGMFVKHVLPAAAKPVHSLWHEILGFVFLAFAGIGAFRIWQKFGKLPPSQLLIIVIFVAVMGGYGISSVLKARKISKS